MKVSEKVIELAKESENSRNLITNAITKTPCLRSRLNLSEGSELYIKA